MRSNWKYSKATICRHRKKNIGDLVVDLRKNIQGGPPKLSVRQKGNILRQTKLLQEEMGNFCIKRVMVRASIPSSISAEAVRRVCGRLARNGLVFRGKQSWPKMTWHSGLRLLEKFVVNILQTLGGGCRILFGWSKFYS